MVSMGTDVKATELTRNQALVFRELLAAEGPLGAYAILDRLRGDGLRQSLQVYRALYNLLDRGLVHRLESLNAFVVCAHEHEHRHGLAAFAICDRCGQVAEFSDDVIEARLADWAASNGFRPARSAVEIRGDCAACASRPS
jgi:Fur family zinc uptake transcriptional regulator